MVMAHSYKVSRAVFFLFIGLLAVISLAACSSPAASTPTRPAATATEAPKAATPTEAATATEAAATAAVEEPQTTSGVSFAKDVLPILEASCVKCHGGERTQEGLDVTSYAGLIKGSDNGVVLVAGDAATSTLVELINAGKMPKRAPKLSDEQIKLITDWINAGAQDN